MTGSESLVLGIDVGTYETKGVLVDPAGTIAWTHRRPHRMSVPRPGFANKSSYLTGVILPADGGWTAR